MKPIHKFNGGIGATLCHKCKAIITEGLTDDLYCNKCDPQPLTSRFKYVLVRKNDELIQTGNTIGWIEWNEDRTAKTLHKTPEVGYSCLLGNRGWLTTPITSLEVKDDVIKFTTLNSEYELFIGK